MKKKLLWIVTFFFLFFLVLASGFVLHSFLKKEESVPTFSPTDPPSKEQPEEKKKLYYLCTTEKSRKGAKDVSYQYQLQYQFLVYDQKLENGTITEICTFASQQLYQQFLSYYPKEENNFKRKEIPDKLQIQYVTEAIIPNSKDSLTYTSSYLELLKQNGYQCEIDASKK